jgi:hypothetical protein
MLKHRPIIRFLLKEGVAPKDIPAGLSERSGEDAMKKSQVFYWISEACRGRENISGEQRPGRPPEVGLDTILIHRLEMNPCTTGMIFAWSLGVSPQILVSH